MGVTVTTPDGREWHVRRRWLRRPKWRDFDAWGDVPFEVFFVNELPGLVVAAVLSLLFGIVIFVLLPLTIFLVEGALLGVAAYMLGRTWLVEAETNGPPAARRSWRVRGWRRSRRAVEEVASELKTGVEAAPDDGERAQQPSGTG